MDLKNFAINAYKQSHSTWCSAAGCGNSRGKNPCISFFQFPASPERCRKWAKNANRPDLEGKDSKALHRNNCLCEEHFPEDQFMCPADKGKPKKWKRLMPNALPTLFERKDLVMECDSFQPKTEKQKTFDNRISCNTAPTKHKNDKNTHQEEDSLSAQVLSYDMKSSNSADIVTIQITHPASTPGNVMRTLLISDKPYESLFNLNGGRKATEKASSKIKQQNCQENGDIKLREQLERNRKTIVRLRNKVQRLNTTKKKKDEHEKVEGIIKLVSKYLEGETLTTFAAQIRQASKNRCAVDRLLGHKSAVTIENN